MGAVPLVLDNASVLDIKARQVRYGQALVIRDERIHQQGNRSEFGSLLDDPGVARLDLGGAFLMPGLADCHVHLLSRFAAEFGGREMLERQSVATLAYLCAKHAEEALMSGITMLRVVGEAHYLDVDLRDSIARGLVRGPRIVASGHIIIRTAGHGSGSLTSVEADGPYGLLTAVRAEIRAGVDFVKLMASGGVASLRDPYHVPQFLDEELETAVNGANATGKPVAVHAGEPRLIQRCSELGVRSVEHGYVIDERAADAMAQHGTYLVPTLVVTKDEEYISKRPSWIQERARRAAEGHMRSFEIARAAGVRIVAGTDVPEFCEYIHRELALLHFCGMPMWEVLASATMQAAEMCGLGRDLGSVEQGKIADLIAFRSNPVESESLRHPMLVIKSGVVYRSEL